MFNSATTAFYTLFTFFACVFLGVCNIITFLRLRIKKPSAKATIAKACTSFGFIFAWISLALVNMSQYAAFIGLGLLCGLLGDIFLDLKYCCPQDEDIYTKSGFAAFAVGHFFYMAAVVAGCKPGFYPMAILPTVIVGVLVGIVVYTQEEKMKLHYGKYKIISTLYGGLLFAMYALALSSAVFGGVSENKHLIVVAIGGVLFAVSDLILSGTYFGEGKNRPKDIILNHVTYYMAQFVIASSLFFYK